MWRSGVTRRRSEAALVELVEVADRTGDYQSPWRACPGVRQHFRNEGEILRELQRQWRTALAGAIYVAIEEGTGDLRHDVITALKRVERRHRPLRRILEANCEHPSIAPAMRKERSLLSSFVGSTDGGARC